MAESYAFSDVPKADRDLIERVKLRFKQGEEADKNQRDRERDDLGFYAGEQWDPAVKASRMGQAGMGPGLPPLPARPTYVINKCREPVRQVLNEERAADMGVEIAAADDFEGLVGPIDDSEIELREGLVRRIQRQSDAADARTWAFARSTIAGQGVYRVMTRYLPGKTFDQEVYVERIYDQAGVMFDPVHQQPDGSDAAWINVGVDLPWDKYQREMKHALRGDTSIPNPLADASGEEFRLLGEEAPGWFHQEGELKMCRILEHWYTESTTRTLCSTPQGNVWKDELPEGATVIDERDVTEQKIKWLKTDGVQILERTDWQGPDMPFVKVLGEELLPYDKERRVEGMIRPARDSQRGFNSMVSKWVETVALAPIPPLQWADGQIDGFEKYYEAAAFRTVAGLPYNTKSRDGAIGLGPPVRTPVDTPISAIAGSIQMFSEGISATTGVDSQLAHLGHSDPALKSGKAIAALQAQQQHGTSGYLDNLKRSIRYEGQILNNLLAPIYGTPGRLVRIVTGEGESKTIRMAAAPTTTAPRQQPMAPGGEKQYHLTPGANFNVLVKVTRSFASRREQEMSQLGELISAQPQLMGVFGDLFFKHQDGPGHQEMAERAKVMLVPPVQALIAKQGGQEQIPPQAQQHIQQLEQRLQEIEGIAKEQHQQLETKSLEQQTKVLIAKAEIDSKEKIAAMDRETKLAVAELGAKVDRMTLFLEERERVGLQLSQQAHEHHQADLERQHTEKMTSLGMAHDAATGQMGHEAAAESQAGQQSHEADMAAQAQAVEPQETA